MSAVKRDIIIEQGVDFSLLLTWESPAGSPVDLTSYTAALQIRSAYGGQPEILALAQGSGITLGGTAGTVTVAITAAQTGAIEAPNYASLTTYAGEPAYRLGVYDLVLTSGVGQVRRFIYGTVYLSPQVVM